MHVRKISIDALIEVQKVYSVKIQKEIGLILKNHIFLQSAVYKM